jgi:hypothetical protein
MGREEGAILPHLITIIRQLRTPVLPESLLNIPIVLLYDYRIGEKVEKFIKGYKRLVYVQGSPLKLKSLLKVGTDRCSKMLIVSGGNGRVETVRAVYALSLPPSLPSLTSLMTDQDATQKSTPTTRNHSSPSP